MICGGRYLSADQAVRVFARDPDSAKPMRLEVRWRNGDQSTIANVQPNRIYEVNQGKPVVSSPLSVVSGPPGSTRTRDKESRTNEQPFFRDVSAWIGHTHQEDSFDDWARQPLLPRRLSRLGPGVSWYDFDGDGDLDLFVGGRFRPGRYPEPVSSALWVNEQGELRLSRSLSEPFQSLGLVSGATFADLDGDGHPDLALAVEWGPVRVFRNNDGHFEEMTTPWGFAGRTGWWTSVTTGDFDGDGRLDLAVGNWGRNTIYELYRKVEPPETGIPNVTLRLFYDDWNSDGTIELIEAWRHG